MRTPDDAWTRPSIHELGPDLLRISRTRLAFALACPFLFFAAYFGFAAAGRPLPAFLAVVALSFVTYGSVSHDLVHANLGLPPWVNRLLLSVVELMMVRSGTVYRIVRIVRIHARTPCDFQTMVSRPACGALSADQREAPRKRGD